MNVQTLLEQASKHFRYSNRVLECMLYPEADSRYAFSLHAITNTRFHYPYGISLKPLPCYAILYTFDGVAKLRLENRSYTLTKDVTAYFDCACGFDIEITDTARDWDFTLAFISGDSLPYYYADFARENEVTISSQHSPAIASTFGQLYSNAISRQEGSALIFSKLICDLMTYLTLDRSILSEYGETPDHIIQIISYIKEHYMEKITLDSIAAHFAMSKYTLSRDFTACFNQSLIDYLIDFRVDESKKLLEFTSLPISEIATLTGFSTMNNFIQQFKKRTNLTPTAFRRENQIYSSKQRLSNYNQQT